MRLFDSYCCSHKLLLKSCVKQNHCSVESCDGSLNLINKWLYKRVSRNDLPIKDQNFTILCIEVIYSMKPVPNVKMLAKINYIIVISQWPLFVQRWHAHTGLIMYIINEFLLTIKELLPIYHMTEKRQTTCI